MKVTIVKRNRKHWGSKDFPGTGKYMMILSEFLLTLDMLDKAGIHSAPGRLVETHSLAVSAGYIANRGKKLTSFGYITSRPIESKHGFSRNGLCLAYSLTKKGRQYIELMDAGIRAKIEQPLYEKNIDLVSLRDKSVSDTDRFVHDQIVKAKKHDVTLKSHTQPEPEPETPAPEPEQPAEAQQPETPEPVIERGIPVKFLGYKSNMLGNEPVLFIHNLESKTFGWDRVNSFDGFENIALIGDQREAVSILNRIMTGSLRLIIVDGKIEGVQLNGW